MRKKQIAVAVFFVMAIFILASCGKKHESNRSEDIAKDNIAIDYYSDKNDEKQTQNNESSLSEYEDANITYMGQYYEDRTWVICGWDWLLIDTKGNAILKVTGAVDTPGKFEGGYSQLVLTGKNVCYTININGEIVSQFASENNVEQMIAYGGGYIMTKEDISNFDSVGYKYRVYNPDGSLNGSFVMDDDFSSARYMNKGVFRMQGGYYCAKSAVWIESVPYSFDDISSEFDGDKVVLGHTYGSNGEGCSILTLSANGVIEEVFPEELSNSCSISELADDYCVIYDEGNRKIFSFNVETGASYVLDEAYYNKLADDAKPEAPVDGRIAIPMEGADGKIYSAIFDTKFNLVAKEQLGDFGGASEGRFVAAVDSIFGEVYDTNGNFLFSISDMGYEAYVANKRNEYFSCGALLVKKKGLVGNHYQFIDTDGNLLFEDINFKNVKTLSLE